MTNSSQINNDWGQTDGGAKFIPTSTFIVTKENKLIYIIGIIALSISVLSTIIGIIALSYYEKEIPQSLIAIGSVATAGLCGLFSYSK